nr:uncharacterized protein LOC109162703 [Ipomoea batatas]
MVDDKLTRPPPRPEEGTEGGGLMGIGRSPEQLTNGISESQTTVLVMASTMEEETDLLQRCTKKAKASNHHHVSFTGTGTIEGIEIQGGNNIVDPKQGAKRSYMDSLREDDGALCNVIGTSTPVEIRPEISDSYGPWMLAPHRRRRMGGAQNGKVNDNMHARGNMNAKGNLGEEGKETDHVKQGRGKSVENQYRGGKSQFSILADQEDTDDVEIVENTTYVKVGEETGVEKRGETFGMKEIGKETRTNLKGKGGNSGQSHVKAGKRAGREYTGGKDKGTTSGAITEGRSVERMVVNTNDTDAYNMGIMDLECMEHNGDPPDNMIERYDENLQAGGVTTVDVCMTPAHLGEGSGV